MSATESRRLSSEDRREQILAAASTVFGERGYVGGTTDAIAREAGISQAYVVRMFGSKENLFRATAERAAAKVQEAFQGAIDSFTGDETPEQRRYAMALAYTRLLEDRGLMLTLLHLWSLGHDETFGPLARQCFLDAYRLMRDGGGLTSESATESFAQGMLVTVLFAMRMPDLATDVDARDLMTCAFGDKMTDLIQLSHLQQPLDDARR